MSGLRLTCVVTGATSGIGKEAALLLAALGHDVLGVGRSEEKCRKAAEEVRARGGNRNVDYLQADLSSLSDIRRLARAITARMAKIDVLINNAGVFTLDRRETVDGVEMQLAVNWLSAFALTGLLMHRLLRSSGARIVNLSSGSHFAGTMHWSDLGLRRGYRGLKAYDQSKLAMILFTSELGRRFPGFRDPRAYAVDPGLVRTQIAAKGNNALVRLVWKVRTRNGITAERAAQSVVWCATDPAAAGRTGLYWKERTPRESSAESHDPEAARRLWEIGESLSGVRYPCRREETPALLHAAEA